MVMLKGTSLTHGRIPWHTSGSVAWRMSTGSHPEPDGAPRAAVGIVGELLWCRRRTAEGNALQPAAKVTAPNQQ